MEPGEIEQAFGRTLRRLRRERGITQDELSSESGLDRSFLSRLETGRRQPSISTMVRIAAVLGLPVSQLVKEFEKELEGK